MPPLHKIVAEFPQHWPHCSRNVLPVDYFERYAQSRRYLTQVSYTIRLRVNLASRMEDCRVEDDGVSSGQLVLTTVSRNKVVISCIDPDFEVTRSRNVTFGKMVRVWEDFGGSCFEDGPRRSGCTVERRMGNVTGMVSRVLPVKLDAVIDLTMDNSAFPVNLERAGAFHSVSQRRKRS